VHTEQVVLAAMLVDASTRRRLVRVLPPERWQVPEHRAAVVALAEIDRRKVAYDPAAVKRLFPDVDVDYLAQLTAVRPDVPVDLAHYVEGVRWDALRAEAMRGPIADLIAALVDPQSDPAKVKSLARGIGQTFDAWRDDARILDPEDVYAQMCAELDARLEGHGLYPYGLDAIDVYQDEDGLPPRLIPGMKPGKITIVTGTPGSGKSTLACRIALGQIRRKRRVLYGAWEMTGPESLELLAVMSLAEQGERVSRKALQTGKGTGVEEMMAAVKARAKQIAPFCRFVRNPFQRGQAEDKKSNDRNLDIIQHLIEEVGADVLIADLWERCLVDEEMDAVKRALFDQQKICEETKCHGVLLHQQRKGAAGGADPRPTAAALRGTGAWWDIGDTILGCFRPGQWKAVPDDLVVVDVLKQRWAPWPLSIEVEFDPDRAWFGKGTSVPYDQPGGGGGSDEMDGFLSGGGKRGGGKRRHHG
jgi:archaellum biogenesis ATPase FlaH